MMVIHGDLQFPYVAEPMAIARVEISVRNVTTMDGPASVLGHIVLHGVHVGPDVPTRVPFELAFTPLSTQAICAVRAHADVNGNGRVDVGDFVSDTATLIDFNNTEHRFTIELRFIGIN